MKCSCDKQNGLELDTIPSVPICFCFYRSVGHHLIAACKSFFALFRANIYFYANIFYFTFNPSSNSFIYSVLLYGILQYRWQLDEILQKKNGNGKANTPTFACSGEETLRYTKKFTCFHMRYVDYIILCGVRINDAINFDTNIIFYGLFHLMVYS